MNRLVFISICVLGLSGCYGAVVGGSSHNSDVNKQCWSACSANENSKACAEFKASGGETCKSFLPADNQVTGAAK